MNVPQFSSERKEPLKVGSSTYYSANDFSLTEKELEKARDELHESEEKKVRKLQKLRELLANDKDVNYRMDTPYLLRYLRVRKYDTHKAYKNMKDSYEFKKGHPVMTKIPKNLEQLLDLNILTYLPYTDENGNILFFYDSEKWKYPETVFEEVIQLTTATIDTIVMNPRLQINGFIGIMDMNKLKAQHVAVALRDFGPRALTFGVLNTYPWRVKKVVAINTGTLSRLLYSAVRPFLSKKIADRVILLGSDITELHQHVNPAVLPKKLGGFLEDDQCGVTQNVLDNIPYLKYERSFN